MSKKAEISLELDELIELSCLALESRDVEAIVLADKRISSYVKKEYLTEQLVGLESKIRALYENVKEIQLLIKQQLNEIPIELSNNSSRKNGIKKYIDVKKL
ncbi:hypothetical protein [Marinomonas communis]|uniref:hypothetical protein n=1 Tax=Marinomonas communis TaxID=28254 RepID=UPI001D194BCD|nr:hypothetical protein [Marinomonas communis]MCC4274502.1 hypothetical protein [Marinomonas communis]